jgi:hypothetical protein
MYKVVPQTHDSVAQAEEVLFYIAWAVGQYANPLQWRSTLLKTKELNRPLTKAEADWLRRGNGPRIEPAERMSPADVTAAVNLVSAFDVILTPWFDGTADLRYDKLETLIAAISRGARMLYPSTDRPEAIITQDGRRLSPSDPTTPYLVIRWPNEKPKRGAER